MFKIIASKRAEKQIKNLPRKYQERISEVLAEIKEYPASGKDLNHEFEGYITYKLGVYRIIYKVNEKDQIIRISRVEHRSTVYN